MIAINEGTGSFKKANFQSHTCKIAYKKTPYNEVRLYLNFCLFWNKNIYNLGWRQALRPTTRLKLIIWFLRQSHESGPQLSMCSLARIWANFNCQHSDSLLLMMEQHFHWQQMLHFLSVVNNAKLPVIYFRTCNLNMFRKKLFTECNKMLLKWLNKVKSFNSGCNIY